MDIEDVYSNAFLNDKGHIGIKVVRAIVGYRIGLVFTSRIGEIAYYMLKNKFVDVYKVEKGLSVKEAMERYRLNELEPITAPTHLVEESQVMSQFQGQVL